MLYNKLPQTQQLKTTPIISFFWGVGIWVWLSHVLWLSVVSTMGVQSSEGLSGAGSNSRLTQWSSGRCSSSLVLGLRALVPCHMGLLLGQVTLWQCCERGQQDRSHSLYKPVLTRWCPWCLCSWDAAQPAWASNAHLLFILK